MSTLFDLMAYGYLDREGVLWRLGEGWEANALLSRHHYLGPLRSGARMTIVGQKDGEPVAAMMWKHPTSRGLPADGTWLELSRWCLTPAAGENAGSRMHKWSTRLIRDHLPGVTTLVSYSDPSHGHTGALYRACNWRWAPTWHRLRTPPSGNGDWGTGPQAVKDRWVFCLRHDDRRADVLAVDDAAAVRYWQAHATPAEIGWARRSLNLRECSIDVNLTDLVPRDRLDIEASCHTSAVIPIADVDMRLPQVPDPHVGPIDAHAGLVECGEQADGVCLVPSDIHAASVAPPGRAVPAPGLADMEPVELRLERSSFGTSAAKAARESVSDEQVRRVVRRAEELRRERGDR